MVLSSIRPSAGLVCPAGSYGPTSGGKCVGEDARHVGCRDATPLVADPD
jgi:hypothetical protein